MEVLIMISIQGFSRYTIDENGIIRKGDKQLSPYKGKNGYRFIKLVDDEGKTKHVSVHRLVAKAFLQQEDGKDVVNHIDGIRDNNHVSNLEWTTQAENIRKGYERTGTTPIKFKRECELYHCGNLVKTFSNVKEASLYAEKHFGVKATMLRKWKKNKDCLIRCID